MLDRGATRADLEERAAILEFQEGMSRADAERQALAELAGRLRSDTLYQAKGILAELIAADARRQRADLAETLNALGLIGRRAPAWGFGHIIDDREHYRPAGPGEVGAHAAIIVPATEEGSLLDLVAQDLSGRRLRSRLGVAELIGVDEVEGAKARGVPLAVFKDVTQWIRAHSRGAVIVRWDRAGTLLDGVPAIFTTAGLASRLHDATSRCWPRPVIAVPDARGVRHAA